VAFQFGAVPAKVSRCAVERRKAIEALLAGESGEMRFSHLLSRERSTPASWFRGYHRRPHDQSWRQTSTQWSQVSGGPPPPTFEMCRANSAAKSPCSPNRDVTKPQRRGHRGRFT
jgi:hypothetical protein